MSLDVLLWVWFGLVFCLFGCEGSSAGVFWGWQDRICSLKGLVLYSSHSSAVF